MRVPLILLLALGTSSPSTPAAEDQDVSVQAHFLKRSELPDDIRFPLLELDFRVLRVQLHNSSDTAWTIPEAIQLFNSRNKSLKVVTPAEMTPKIVKSKIFRARQRSAETGPLENIPIYPRPGDYRQYPQGRAAKPAMVDVGAVEGVRMVLESHQLAPGELQPGDQIEGLIYVKSKAKPTDLQGSRLLLGRLEVRTQ